MTDPRERRRNDRKVGVDRRVDEAEETVDAVVVERWGEASTLEAKPVPRPEPGPGEVRVKVAYAGVNYVDVYHRSGLYPKEPPFVAGVEASGVVDALGEGVEDLEPGDRVAGALLQGTYAQEMVAPAWKLARVPDDVGLDVAAAAMVQGMTAHYLSSSTYAIREGDRALVHAAAGGVGLLLVQLAKKRGATVIGTCSTEEKAELVRGAGADHVIRYTEADFLESTMQLTDGQGVHVVYDGVGRTTFDRSLRCLRRRGYLVLFGQASGPVAPVDPQRLARQGSVFLTRPSLHDYMTDNDEVREHADAVFSWIRGGQLDVRIDRVLPLADAAKAHQLLEDRKTAGKVLLAGGVEG